MEKIVGYRIKVEADGRILSLNASNPLTVGDRVEVNKKSKLRAELTRISYNSITSLRSTGATPAWHRSGGCYWILCLIFVKNKNDCHMSLANWLDHSI